jgi:4'-phosphopantetheinyl transferase
VGELVRVWLIRLDAPDGVVSWLAGGLDEAERGRAGRRAHPDQERRYVVAHGAARVIIGRFAGVPADQVDWRRGPNGKPELDGACRGVRVSLSHSGHLAALAITRDRSVGVDVQQFPATMDPVKMAERFYPPDEAGFVVAGGTAAGQLGRFIRLWARKEACVKVTGGVLMQGMRLPVRGTGRILVQDPGGALPGPYLVQDVAAPRHFRGAVAAEGAEPYDVLRQWWHPGAAAGV